MPPSPSRILVCLLLGCDATPPAPAGAQLLWAAPASLPAADLSSLPWPNDLLRDDAGAIRVASFAPRLDLTPLHAHLIDDLAHSDGFGVTTGAFFPVSAPLDPATLDGHVHLLDLEPSAATDAEVPLTVVFRVGDSAIQARPANGHVLLESHAYAYVITAGVHDMAGHAARPSDELAALLAATTRPADPAHARAFDQLQRLAPRLSTVAARLSDTIGYAVFTTQSVTRELRALRAAIQKLPAPVASISYVFAADPRTGDDGSLDELFGKPASQRPGNDNAGGLAHDAIAFVIQGSFVAPDYLFASQPTTDARLATQSTVGIITPGAPVARGQATVPFTLVLPSLPAGGSYASVPTVIFQHGLGGDRKTVCVLANTLAHQGLATIGIDIPFHGQRRGKAVDNAHNFNPSVMTPDGWADDGDSPLLTFFDSAGDKARNVAPLEPAAIRGSFQQSVSDILLEVRLIAEGKLDAAGARDVRLAGLGLRSDKILYSGESFGSIIGAMVLAVEPRIGAAELSVGGGGFYMPLLTWSVNYGSLGPLLDSALGIYAAAEPPESEFGHNLIEQLDEPSDPLAMARHVIDDPLDGAAPRHVLLFQALHDEAVPNVASEALAFAMGLEGASVTAGGTPHFDWVTPRITPHAAPLSGNRMVAGHAVTAAILQFTVAAHSMITMQNGTSTAITTERPFRKLPAPVAFANPIDALHQVYGSFAADFFAGRTPTLPDVK